MNSTVLLSLEPGLKKTAGFRQQFWTSGFNRPAVQLALNCKRNTDMHIKSEGLYMGLFYYKQAVFLNEVQSAVHNWGIYLQLMEQRN